MEEYKDLNNTTIDDITTGINEQEEIDDYEIKRFSFNSYKIERSIRDILDWLDRKKIEVPNFQRHSVWTYNQGARFIESILLGLPTPDLFMYRKVVGKEEKYLLVDGFQRLTTIQQFYMGKYKKHDGDKGDHKSFYIPFKNSNWSKKNYLNLDETDKDYFNDYSLKISVFDSIDKADKTTENNLMTAIFERINTGSTTLSSQEIRHAVYHGISTNRLVELAQNGDYKELIKKDSGKDYVRRNAEEFYLRLLTYLYVYKQKIQNINTFDSEKSIKFLSSKKIMLNNFLQYINSSNSIDTMDALSNELNAALYEINQLSSESFYAYSLLREKIYDKVYEPFSEALVIAVCTFGTSKYNESEFAQIKNDIWLKYNEDKNTYKEFFENTTSIDNVIKRVNVLKNLLCLEKR